MKKQKLWFKKRTTRGRGRVFVGREHFSTKNLEREILKNQRWYSHFLLKFVFCALLGLIWLRLGVTISLFGANFAIFPLGFCVGLIIILLEQTAKLRYAELFLLFFATYLSFLFPIGFVL